MDNKVNEEKIHAHSKSRMSNLEIYIIQGKEKVINYRFPAQNITCNKKSIWYDYIT